MNTPTTPHRRSEGHRPTAAALPKSAPLAASTFVAAPEFPDRGRVGRLAPPTASRVVFVLVLAVGFLLGAPASFATVARRSAAATTPVTVSLINSNGGPMAYRSFVIDDTSYSNDYTFQGETNGQGRAVLDMPDGPASLEANVLYLSNSRTEYLQAPGVAAFREPSNINRVLFRFQLTGLRPGDAGTLWSDYYGGSIFLRTWYMPSTIPSTSTVEFVLIPVGPLADGTIGRTLVMYRSYADILQGQSSPLDTSAYLFDIPLGTYKLDALIEWPGQPLARLTVLDGGYQDEGGLIVFDASVRGEAALSGRTLDVALTWTWGVRPAGSTRPNVRRATLPNTPRQTRSPPAALGSATQCAAPPRSAPPYMSRTSAGSCPRAVSSSPLGRRGRAGAVRPYACPSD